MKKILIFTLAILVSICCLAMETDRQESPKKKLEDLEDAVEGERISKRTKIESDVHSPSFARLPDEVILYIFEFVISKETSASMASLRNTLRNKINIAMVNNQWKRISQDEKLKIFYTKHVKLDIENLLFEYLWDFEKNKKNIKTILQIIRLSNLKLANSSIELLLFKAIENRKKELFELSLKYIDKLDINKQFQLINSKNGDGCTILRFAICYSRNNQEIIQLLLKYIERFNKYKQLKLFRRSNFDNRTSLRVAMITKGKGALELLLKFIKKFDTDTHWQFIGNVHRIEGSLLHNCVLMRNKEQLILLLKDIEQFDGSKQLKLLNAKDDCRRTALDIVIADTCGLWKPSLKKAYTEPAIKLLKDAIRKAEEKIDEK